MKRSRVNSYSNADFKKHLKQEHRLSPLSEYLQEIVYGGVDGIITTFAVVAGFTGANSGDVVSYSFLAVLLFGFANLFADGVSMGLGNFLSIRTQKGVYKTNKDKELYEIRNDPEMEKVETRHILETKGFSKKQAVALTQIYAKNEKYWLSFMMNHELEMPNPESVNPLLTALVTFVAFLLFGLIPLTPYFFIQSVFFAFIISCLSTLAALILLGVIRFRFSKETFIHSVGEMVLLGSVSASVAFVVGLFFRG